MSVQIIGKNYRWIYCTTYASEATNVIHVDEKADYEWLKPALSAIFAATSKPHLPRHSMKASILETGRTSKKPVETFQPRSGWDLTQLDC
jgi:hypothetical protein